MIEYELEYLNWEKRQLTLRQKYMDTPPGLTLEQVQEEEKRLLLAWNEYEGRHRCRLTSAAQIPEEPFVGRGNELKEIRRLLAGDGHTVFLSGMGGIGKSALARTYGRVYAGEYDQILSLSYGKSLEQILADDGQLGISNLLYTQGRYHSIRQYAREKYEKLVQIAGSERLLVILDNYNQMEDPWLAEFMVIPCDLLVTTRLSSALLSERGYTALSVEPFSKEEDWLDFYRLYTGREPEGMVWEKVAAYREQVQGHTLKMKLALSNPEQSWTKEHLAKSFLANFRLKKPQIQILCELSFLTVLGIPEEVYLSCTEEKRESLELLKSYSLIQERRENSGEVFLALHPVIAEAVSTTWHPSLTRCLKFVEKFAVYARFSWYRPKEGDLWLLPQVFALVDRLPKPVAWRYYPYECLATFLMVWEYFDEALQLELSIYECVKNYYGENQQFTAYMAFRVAGTYYDAMQFEKSKCWYELSFRMYETAKPVNHSFYHDKAENSAKLARVYEYEKNYEAAFHCLDVAEQAMEDFREATEKNDPELWQLRRNRLPYVYMRRASLYFKLGDLKRAQQELDTGLNLFPLDEFRAVEVRRLQARIYLAQGEYDMARDAAARDLEICVRYQGESYKMSLTCREVLGDALRGLGDIQAANEEYLKVMFLLQEKYPHQTAWMERLRQKLGAS